MLELGWIHEAELEHRIHDRRHLKTTFKVIPDAALYGEKKGVKFTMAFELELTRKNNQRIIEKAGQYLDGGQFNYVLYLFSKKSLMEKYMEVLSERHGEEIFDRMMFFYDENLTAKAREISSWKGFFKGKSLQLEELFS